jgi:CRP-like cAMP-binding protein
MACGLDRAVDVLYHGRQGHAGDAVPASPTDLLQSMALFGGLRADVVEALVAMASTVRLPGHAAFFREGEPGVSLYLLLQGQAAVIKRWEGRDYLLKTLDPGDCFGEMAVLDLYPRSASVVALSDCEALELSAEALHRLYHLDAGQFAIVLMNIGRELSRRLRAADQRLFEHRVEARVEHGDHVFHAI